MSQYASTIESEIATFQAVTLREAIYKMFLLEVISMYGFARQPSKQKPINLFGEF